MMLPGGKLPAMDDSPAHPEEKHIVPRCQSQVLVGQAN